MVIKVQGTRRNDVEIAHAEAPHLAKVDWKTDPGLRKLYFWAFIICIASATTGYDAYAASSMLVVHYAN
jgi:hypothetical protein